MKQILLFGLLLNFAITTTAQYADTTRHTLATEYLTKSKKQKTGAWILLGGGALVTTIGIGVGLAEVTGAVVTAVFSGQQESTSSAGGVLLLTGVAAMVGSIPLFIASGKKRKKAEASVSFRMENATNIYRYIVSKTRYPAVAIQIRL